MAPYFLDLEGAPDQGFVTLREVFNLDEQRAESIRS